MKVKSALRVHVVETIITEAFESRFRVLALEVSSLLDGLTREDLPAAKNIREMTKMKVSITDQPWKQSSFDRNSDPILEEIGSEQERQIFLA